jgi:hypothetical protein
MAKKIEAPSAILDIPVAFGNVNVGDTTARLGCSSGRGTGGLTITQADRNLCGKRLKAKILARTSGGSDQGSLPGAEADPEIEAVFDVKSFNVSGKHIGFGLTVQINSINISTLTHFAKREGRLAISEIADIPEDQKGGDDAEE